MCLVNNNGLKTELVMIVGNSYNPETDATPLEAGVDCSTPVLDVNIMLPTLLS